MASFDAVNYGLRPSKGIQRQLAFEGAGALRNLLQLDQLAYVGFGSIWFVDFVLAHKMLGVRDMISIESDPIGHARAVFNAPFATIRVIKGNSSDVLPQLYEDPALNARPWMIWLDYDYAFDESVKGDLASIIERAPPNSIVLVSINAHPNAYGSPPDRPARLRQLLGASVPDDLPKAACNGDRMQETLARFVADYLASVASDVARPGRFVPAFRMLYKDSAPMVTVGGVLSSEQSADAVSQLVGGGQWKCILNEPIIAPHLTLREAAVLQSCLPREQPLTRADVQALGFDLEQEQLSVFVTHYRHYPSFAQVFS